jgi:hypothetical protein
LGFLFFQSDFQKLSHGSFVCNFVGCLCANILMNAPPLCAVQRSGSGRWLVWAPTDDFPCAPAVRLVAVFDEPAYASAEKRRGGAVIRSFRSWQSRVPKTRAEIDDIAWPRQELLEIADLLSRLDVCLARELFVIGLEGGNHQTTNK